MKLNPGEDKSFTKLDENIVDIYATSQTITVSDSIDSYELKFSVVSYNKEKIFFGQYLIIDTCKEENNILICPITKNELCEYLNPSSNEISIYYLNSDNDLHEFPLVSKIKIIFNNIKKIDIYVEITRLLVKTIESNIPVAYETNVTDISEMNENFNLFDLPFEKEEDDESKDEGECSFVKYVNTNLLLLCWVSGGGSHRWLKEITTEKIINNVNVKYNFRIQPVNISDKIEISNKAGFLIKWYYPKVLNFKDNDGPLYIDYSMEKRIHSNGLTFNEEETDLECEEEKGKIKRCKIPKTHFKGKKNGFYFLKYTYHLGGKAIYYEATPMQVIVETDSESSNGNTISLYMIYLLLFIFVFI